MSSININKTTGNVVLENDGKIITDEMSNKIKKMCDSLLVDSNKFKKEKTFELIYKYIKEYRRILYSQISNIIYAYYDTHTIEEASNTLGTMISNIEQIVAYTGTEAYSKKKEEARKSGDLREYEDTEKALVKIWDHINLAQTQYNGLKQSDEEYKRKFDKSITPFKDELAKDMNSQLITMVGIFTALSFLIFGGISSLDNIFASQGVPLLKLMIIGSIWGLCILNLVFVFLFCVGKMTKLNFKSTNNNEATIFQKYPIVWWSNLVITSIMLFCMWCYYLTKRNIHTWFDKICFSNPMIATLLGFLVICILVIGLMIGLLKATKNTSENDE